MLLNARLLHRAARSLLVCGLALVCAATGHAQPASPGKPLTIVVGTPAGGGYDAYARLAARHLGSALGGNTRIVVQNMPGAGSLIATNFIANAAPKDGTTIALLPNATMLEALLGNTSARFDARKMNMLGSLNEYTAIGLVWHQTPFMSAQDLLTHEAVVGASAAASGNSVLPNLLNSLIQTKFKVVNGYPGSAGLALALERGEIQAMVGDDLDFIRATRPDWLRDKKIRILLQGTLKRHPDLADVPTALEFASAENREVLELLLARQTYSGIFLAPPEVPAAVVAGLRAGFAKMVDDPDFRREAEQSSLTIHAASADEVTATIGRLLASPQSVIARASAELQRIVPK